MCQSNYPQLEHRTVHKKKKGGGDAVPQRFLGSPEFSEKIVHWGLGSLIQVARPGNQNSHISPFGAGINNLFAKVYRVALPKHIAALFFCEIEVRCSAEHGAGDCSILQSYDAAGENSLIGL